jgi:hypothetical protein
MRIIGFNFTKIKVERLKEPSELTATELKINTNIDVLELKEVKSNILKTKEEIVGAKFVYEVNYAPDFAKIELEGKILISVDPKTAKEILKQWKKKKLPEDFNFLLFNVVLKKCSLKALFLEEELNLPLHMPMPSLKKGEK